MMNRRNFLAAAAAAAFAPAMFVRAAETKRKVVVVGGGLAGLSLAACGARAAHNATFYAEELALGSECS